MANFWSIPFIWRPPSLSELTPMIFNTGLTHLGSEASICIIKIQTNIKFMLIYHIQGVSQSVSDVLSCKLNKMIKWVSNWCLIGDTPIQHQVYLFWHTQLFFDTSVSFWVMLIELVSQDTPILRVCNLYEFKECVKKTQFRLKTFKFWKIFYWLKKHGVSNCVSRMRHTWPTHNTLCI